MKHDLSSKLFAEAKKLTPGGVDSLYGLTAEEIKIVEGASR